MRDDFKTSASQFAWVVDAHTLSYAVLLLTGGKLADFVGRRKIFLAMPSAARQPMSEPPLWAIAQKSDVAVKIASLDGLLYRGNRRA